MLGKDCVTEYDDACDMKDLQVVMGLVDIKKFIATHNASRHMLANRMRQHRQHPTSITRHGKRNHKNHLQGLVGLPIRIALSIQVSCRRSRIR